MLIPQIEAMVRAITDEGPILKKGRRPGALNLRNLDELLQSKQVVDLLGEDIPFYLRVLFTDPRGWNLRNDVCHGIPPAAAFGPGMANRVFHTLLLLGCLRAKEAPDSPQS
jgi:hypothetical protein